jgi:hypothetical protein
MDRLLPLALSSRHRSMAITSAFGAKVEIIFEAENVAD